MQNGANGPLLQYKSSTGVPALQEAGGFVRKDFGLAQDVASLVSYEKIENKKPRSIRSGVNENLND
jgi:hypothetical protein